jgi:adenylate cyclase
VRLDEAADAVGVTPDVLQGWVEQGLILQYHGEWTPAAVGHARLVARMRERGHSIAEIRRATEEGRLAFGHVTELFGMRDGHASVRDASEETGLSPELIQRLVASLGLRPGRGLSEDEIQLLRYVAAVLDAGLPLEAVVQLTRIYAQAIAQIADAEVRLVHMYVHEPLMRSGTAAPEMSEELFVLAGELLPLASPLLDQLHRRMLAHYVEQDIVGHMEAELAPEQDEVGRMRVAIAFADLAGYTRLTEEAGERYALDVVERFTDAVTVTLPEEARVVKTIGDGVMVVGPDPAALAAWAVGFQELQRTGPLPRIAIHYGNALYRDGDYYGRDVNIAARVAARALGGEVLLTRAVLDSLPEDAFEVERVADVNLKGFERPVEIFRARLRRVP